MDFQKKGKLRMTREPRPAIIDIRKAGMAGLEKTADFLNKLFL